MYDINKGAPRRLAVYGAVVAFSPAGWYFAIRALGVPRAAAIVICVATSVISVATVWLAWRSSVRGYVDHSGVAEPASPLRRVSYRMGLVGVAGCALVLLAFVSQPWARWGVGASALLGLAVLLLYQARRLRHGTRGSRLDG